MADGVTPLAVPPALPPWANVGEKRRDHIERVVALLTSWGKAMRVDPETTRAWLDAGVWHDALRDASEDELRAITGDSRSPEGLLHGPAAAILLERDGERRHPVLDAVRYHTVGWAHWDVVGKALYMADYLEPGRKFLHEDREFLASQVPFDFEGVFRQVVRFRLEWSVREGNYLYPETVALWNSLR